MHTASQPAGQRTAHDHIETGKYRHYLSTFSSTVTIALDVVRFSGICVIFQHMTKAIIVGLVKAFTSEVVVNHEGLLIS